MQRELGLRQRDRDRQGLLVQSRGVGVDDEEGQPAAPGGLVDPGAGHDEDGVGLVDPGDVVLRAPEDPLVTVARRDGRELVRVGPGVGLGDREDHLAAAVGQAGEPLLLLLGRAELRDHLAGDRAGDQQQEQRGAVGGRLLDDDGQLLEAGTAAAVLLGQVDADEAGASERLPDLVGGLPGLRLGGVVGRAEVVADVTDRLAQRLVVGVGAEVHRDLLGQASRAVGTAR